jgi:hypothetical protein
MNSIRKFVETDSALGIPEGGVGRKRRVRAEETVRRVEGSFFFFVFLGILALVLE